ncbi:DUF4345 domain-containing protein [Neorhizobium sp. JUb45]|uniref:AGROH133_08824 family phage infection protein n=1 Tax=unclassified Neorhizobium TaxID=2629175 RepID=UPI001050336F|nr:DUF4345 domain-containing protein [Neorhizobium sp. JUb45]TCR01183.1 hypothetical protein EDF70_105190 [Neorhizobium sp. JUb45]
MEFYFPTELPEQIAFVASAATALIGLFLLVLPGTALRLGGFQVGQITPEGYGATRSTGGLYLGLPICALLFAQDFYYLAVGVTLGFAALGRLLSLFLDRGLVVRNIALLTLQLLLAAGPLGYSLGYF